MQTKILTFLMFNRSSLMTFYRSYSKHTFSWCLNYIKPEISINCLVSWFISGQFQSQNLINIFFYQLANPSISGDEEDEAARAVRSILGQSEHRPPATTSNDPEHQHKELFLGAELAAVEEANKENTGKRQVNNFYNIILWQTCFFWLHLKAVVNFDVTFLFFGLAIQFVPSNVEANVV